MSQAAFPIGRASACIIGQLGSGVRLVKSLFFTLVAPSEFLPNLLVRFVNYATSLELVVTRTSLLIIIATISAVSCASTAFSVLAAATRLSK